jgi:pheromone shutdown protein TraB
LYGITIDESADPRLRSACLRRVTGEDSVVLVGVLHDHPASCYRVQAVIETVAPEILALELPPLAVPLVVQQADDERTPPRLGGEMSAAVKAVDTDRVVGIDGPSLGFCRRLAGELYRERASLSTLRGTAGAVSEVASTALCRRIAAGVTDRTSMDVAVDTPTVYDAERTDDPQRQAADERDRMETATSMMRAFTPPPAAAVHRRARERHMADRLGTLRREGDVVAVVGQAHLDAVTHRLRDGHSGCA